MGANESDRTVLVVDPQAIIIGMSGSDDGGNLIAAGANVFLKKPVDFDHLGSVLR